MAFVAFDGKLDETSFVPFEGELDQAEPEKTPEMTTGSVLRDVAAGALQIGPTALKGVADIARLATGDRVGKDTSEAMERGMGAIRKTVGSERAQAQRAKFQADMANDNVSIGDALLNNKGAIADRVLPTIGSMFLPVGAAGVAGKLAGTAKAAQTLDKAAVAARVASAQKAAGIGSATAQNAASTFVELVDKGESMEDAYLAAGITVPFSVVAGVLMGGGAEVAAARALTKTAAGKTGALQVAKATGKEGGQEIGEEAGQITGEAVATGKTPSATSIGKQLAVAGTLGAVMGGGVDAMSQMTSPATAIEPDPLAVKLKEQIDKGNSPLSRATAAANPELKIEPVVEPVVAPASDPIAQAGQQWQDMAPAPQDELDRQKRIAEAAQGATFDGLPAGESETLPDPLSPEFIDGMPNGTANTYAPGNSTGAGLQASDTGAGLGAGPGTVDGLGADPERTPVDDMVPPAGLPDGAADSAVAPIAGDQINKTWTEFHPASGTLNIPRKEMPQIKSEHRGAMTNFLTARGITATPETVEASSLKPTQREFSQAKVKQALDFKGSDRPILVSNDGFILDGHHQWLAKAQQEAPVKITRLSAPIAELLTTMKEFPSAGMTKDAEPFSPPQGKTHVAQATQAFQAEKEGQEEPASQLRMVLAPQNVTVEPVSPANPGNALVRLRRAQMQRMAQAGFTQLQSRGGQTLMVNPQRNEAMVVTGGPVAVALAQRAIAALPKAADNVALGQTNERVSTGIPGTDRAVAASAAGARTGAGDSAAVGVSQEVRGAELRNAAPGLLGPRGRALKNPQADAAAVAALSAKSTYQIDQADPSSPVTKALDQLLDVMAGLTGVRGIAISDKTKQASDGLAVKSLGRFFVNVDRPQMHVVQTIAHEFKHLTENNPGLKALYDRMYDLIPAEAKASYFSVYLEPGQDIATATPEQLQLLKDEMMADFMGQRFNDRVWLETLAKQKPNLFAQFIKEWIPLLDNLITELKGLIKPTKKLAQKDIDALMKGYVKELEAMKTMAMEVATAWAESNPALAQNSGLIETAADVQFSRRVGPKHSNLTDDYLVPESAIWQDSTGNLINLPALTFKGLNRSYPSAPVRIRIGRHGNETNPMTGRPYGQYGLQHRVSNETETSVKKYRVDGDKTDGEQWADLAVRDLMVGLMAGRSLYAQQDAAKLGVWSPDPGGQAGLWTILQYATDKETGEKFWDVQTVTPRTAKWVADNHRNNAPLPMSGFTFDGLDAQTSSGLAVRTLNELRAPTPIPPSTETVSIDDLGQVVNPRTSAPRVNFFSNKCCFKSTPNQALLDIPAHIRYKRGHAHRLTCHHLPLRTSDSPRSGARRAALQRAHGAASLPRASAQDW